MKRWLLMALLPLLLGAATPPGEPPERIRIQKEWLTALGYFSRQVSTADTAAYREARREFAEDAGASQAPSAFHLQLQNTFERNQRARGLCRGASGHATACLQTRSQ